MQGLVVSTASSKKKHNGSWLTKPSTQCLMTWILLGVCGLTLFVLLTADDVGSNSMEKRMRQRMSSPAEGRSKLKSSSDSKINLDASTGPNGTYPDGKLNLTQVNGTINGTDGLTNSTTNNSTMNNSTMNNSTKAGNVSSNATEDNINVGQQAQGQLGSMKTRTAAEKLAEDAKKEKQVGSDGSKTKEEKGTSEKSLGDPGSAKLGGRDNKDGRGESKKDDDPAKKETDAKEDTDKKQGHRGMLLGGLKNEEPSKDGEEKIKLIGKLSSANEGNGDPSDKKSNQEDMNQEKSGKHLKEKETGTDDQSAEAKKDDGDGDQAEEKGTLKGAQHIKDQQEVAVKKGDDENQDDDNNPDDSTDGKKKEKKFLGFQDKEYRLRNADKMAQRDRFLAGNPAAGGKNFYRAGEMKQGRNKLKIGGNKGKDTAGVSGEEDKAEEHEDRAVPPRMQNDNKLNQAKPHFAAPKRLAPPNK